jgi:sulfotransferase
MRGIHFISGLPRSGSTLLAAILRQNPRFHADMSSPMCSLYDALQTAMTGRHDYHFRINLEQRKHILRGPFEQFYGQNHPDQVIFDTNRIWCSKVVSLTELFPEAKIICCVRNLTWIFDSFERLVRRNPFVISKIFNYDAGGTVYRRVEALNGPTGIVRVPYECLKEAYFGEHALKLLLVTYETLTRSPDVALRAIYEFIGERPYAHNFEDVTYSADEFDERMSTPGLHRVTGKVQFTERRTILPADIVQRFQTSAFWKDPQQIRPEVRVV